MIVLRPIAAVMHSVSVTLALTVRIERSPDRTTWAIWLWKHYG